MKVHGQSGLSKSDTSWLALCRLLDIITTSDGGDGGIVWGNQL
jgi:hypothetical protein